jgi:hypothetical protein
MDSLVQRIKELDQLTFQQLCFQLLAVKYPSARIRYVEGTAGDEGLDVFAGDLSDGPTVWQCKAFQVTIIGDSQKAQIRKSLRDAIKNVAPRVWILCLNMNLDPKAHRWFQRLQKTYAAKGRMIADPLQGIEIARELWLRKTLRNYYFPNVALDPGEMRALVTGTHALDDKSLEQLATENTEQWLERIKDKDPRFFYEVTFGGDRGPDVFPPPHEPGLMAALTDGRKIIKAFARDVEALRLDPVGFEFQAMGDGAHKVLDFIRTGRDQHWKPEEIRGFASTMPFLSGINFEAGKTGLTLRAIPDDKVIPLRLTVKNAAAVVTLDYVEFKKTRAGTHEVELETTAAEPMRLRLVLPTDGSASAKGTIAKSFVGKRVRAVAHACSALRLLQQGCDIELFALQLSAKLGILRVEPLDLGMTPAFFSFIDDLSAIDDRFEADLRLPTQEAFTEADEKTFRLLRAFVINEPIQLSNWTMPLVKSNENAESVPQQLTSTGAFAMEHDSATATLFGTKIGIGRCLIHVAHAEIENLQQTVATFRQAEIGDVVPISLRPISPVQFVLLPAQNSPGESERGGA